MDAIPLIETEEIECARDKTTLLGRGGFGEVHRGEWNGSAVAIKDLISTVLVGAVLEEFEREAIIHVRLRNPNVVQLFGISRDAAFHSLVMELLDTSLFHLLQSPTELSLAERVRMGREIASGLKYLHNQKIVHRDLKSLNVLLTKDRQAKLSDFGLSKLKSSSSALTQSGSVGTPAYLAPETYKRPPQYTPKSDIFALAMVLWELVTRDRPFKDGVREQISMWIIQGEREPIPDTAPAVLRRVIEMCWDKDPEKRPGTEDIIKSLAEAKTQAEAMGPAFDVRNPPSRSEVPVEMPFSHFSLARNYSSEPQSEAYVERSMKKV